MTIADNRYSKMVYRPCGRSGLQLPALSLGLWQNYGDFDDARTFNDIIRFAFDAGITHFDLANNYGPPPGAAERNFGQLLHTELKSHRDELIISTKAGYDMWPGPYGDGGSRKYLIASLNQSLQRLKLDYVDVFYSHRPDPSTPLEETMGALDFAVKSGKALYAGISNYPAALSQRAFELLRQMGTPCIIHQPRYSMLDRWVEQGLLDVLDEFGVGCIAFSPLAQGMLTNKYLGGIPADSRAQKSHGALKIGQITDAVLYRVGELNKLALERGQTLAQLAISWLLKDKRVTSVLVGASSVAQLEDSLKALDAITFSELEIERIENILTT